MHSRSLLCSSNVSTPFQRFRRFQMHSQPRWQWCSVWPWLILATCFTAICIIALADRCSRTSDFHTRLRRFYDLLSFTWWCQLDITEQNRFRQESMRCSLLAVWWCTVSLAHSFICCIKWPRPLGIFDLVGLILSWLLMIVSHSAVTFIPSCISKQR